MKGLSHKIAGPVLSFHQSGPFVAPLPFYRAPDSTETAVTVNAPPEVHPNLFSLTQEGTRGAASDQQTGRNPDVFPASG